MSESAPKIIVFYDETKSPYNPNPASWLKTHTSGLQAEHPEAEMVVTADKDTAVALIKKNIGNIVAVVATKLLDTTKDVVSAAVQADVPDVRISDGTLAEFGLQYLKERVTTVLST